MNTDLLKIFWIQDEDLGFRLDYAKKEAEEDCDKKVAFKDAEENCDNTLSFKKFVKNDDYLQHKKDAKITHEEEKKEEVEEDIWAGIDYTIDTETGEYIKIEKEETNNLNESEIFAPIPEFLLDEALGLADKYDESHQGQVLPLPQFCLIDQHCNRVGNLLSNPVPEIPPYSSYVLDARVPTTNSNINIEPFENHYGAPIIVNALKTSMSLTNNSYPIVQPVSLPQWKPAAGPQWEDTVSFSQEKYSNRVKTNRIDNFISTILTDEDLEVMDMALNEGMYTMHSLDTNDLNNFITLNNDDDTPAAITSLNKNNVERLDTGSDSAVSLLGSDRLSNLSDGDWCDTGSESATSSSGDNFFGSKSSEYFGYPQIIKKKRQMIGKRHFSINQTNQTDAKISHAKPEANTSKKRSRDKTKLWVPGEGHLSRDERRAKEMNLSISVDDIINLPMDEFNERVSKQDLTENQLSLIRDIRRRGKNKVAAQNCRKRKLDEIMSLADEVKEMRDKKIRLIDDHRYASMELKRRKDKFQQLYRHVFQSLRDSNGNHYSPYQYSLQTAADGSMVMVPKEYFKTYNFSNVQSLVL